MFRPIFHKFGLSQTFKLLNTWAWAQGNFLGKQFQNGNKSGPLFLIVRAGPVHFFKNGLGPRAVFFTVLCVLDFRAPFLFNKSDLANLLKLLSNWAWVQGQFYQF